LKAALRVQMMLVLLCVVVIGAHAQQSPTPTAPDPPSPPAESTKIAVAAQPQAPADTNKKKKDDRMFYVMPNYLTVANADQVQPISAGEKFKMTAEGTFDPYEFFIVGVLAGIRQADHTNPGFGEGAAGFGKRYGTAFADQAIGNIMVGGVLPSLLRTDPRYFQLGTGGFVYRAGYAFSRIFVTRTDSGGHTFNFSEFAGNGVATGISTFYYPAQGRSVSGSLANWGTQMVVDAFGNELKEFWPDIHRKLHRRHRNSDATFHSTRLDASTAAPGFGL